jgi:hypothetical protein
MTSSKRLTPAAKTPIRPKREAVALETPSFICALDPNRALIRCVFFLNKDSNKYISVAFYPQQGYSVLVELGTAKSAPLRLSEHLFIKVTEHVPAVIQAICADKYYVSDFGDNFKVVARSLYQTAKFLLSLGKNRKEVVPKLN